MPFRTWGVICKRCIRTHADTGAEHISFSTSIMLRFDDCHYRDSSHIPLCLDGNNSALWVIPSVCTADGTSFRVPKVVWFMQCIMGIRWVHHNMTPIHGTIHHNICGTLYDCNMAYALFVAHESWQWSDSVPTIEWSRTHWIASFIGHACRLHDSWPIMLPVICELIHHAMIESQDHDAPLPIICSSVLIP